eukprot:1818573-Prymnesium_polylepis.1
MLGLVGYRLDGVGKIRGALSTATVDCTSTLQSGSDIKKKPRAADPPSTLKTPPSTLKTLGCDIKLKICGCPKWGLAHVWL